MELRTLTQTSARLMPAALILMAAVALPLNAEERRRTSAPSQDEGPRVRVESSSRSSSSDSGQSGGSSATSSDSGRTSVSRGSGDSSSSPSGRTRVDRRRDGGSSGGYSHRHSYGRHYYYPRYGWYGYWPWWWGGGYYRYYDSYGYGPYDNYGPGRYSRYERESGALDLDVSPDQAEIYVDGQYIGVADDFDGFPAYLWLPKGTYDVVIYLPGFKTIARQYSIYPGLVVDVEDEMDEGESVRPEDLVSKSTVNRDERLRRDREREEDVEREVERESSRPSRRPIEAEKRESGRLKLELEPGDASVYLDGRFLGTAADLGRLHAGMIVEPGSHKLEVVRPGFESESVEFEVEPGEEAEVRIELDEEED